MMYIENIKSSLPVFSALDSEIRLKIIELLTIHKSMNLNEIAKELDLSNAAITMHMRKLEISGLISIEAISGKRGTQKKCVLNEEILVIKLRPEDISDNSYDVDMNVGYYSNYQIEPTCGLASWNHFIGEVDDPRYFADTQRISAEILWFHQGFIEYRIPNYLKPGQIPSKIQISMEIGSEAPGYCEDWPSDIYFTFNGVSVGYWTSPGDFGERRGLLNPEWWPNINQYGLLKLLSISQNGTFVDGIQISDVCINDLKLNYQSDFVFRLSVPEYAQNVGGVTLYGLNFGNYKQGLRARVIYQTQKTATQK